jgi:hypothetical protein
VQEVHTAVRGRPLKHIDRLRALRSGEVNERGRCANDRAERCCGTPTAQVGDLSVHTTAQPRFVRGVEDALEDVLLRINGSDFAAERGEVERGPLVLRARHEHATVRARA